jgi:2,3,4,5-tetrahydropyridine-2-carboxylate N-succinyltransferase
MANKRMGKKSGGNVLSYSKWKLKEAGIFEYHDKMLIKKTTLKKGVRVVQVHLQYGSFIFQVVYMVPSYVNIGAYVDAGTMVDT